MYPGGARVGGSREELSQGLEDEGLAKKENANVPGFIPEKEEELSNLKLVVVGGQVPQSQATP